MAVHEASEQGPTVDLSLVSLGMPVSSFVSLLIEQVTATLIALPGRPHHVGASALLADCLCNCRCWLKQNYCEPRPDRHRQNRRLTPHPGASANFLIN